MYESFFKLSQRPFVAAPRVDRYFPGGVIEHARQTLTRTIERAEGSALVIGPAGTGKSLMCRVLAEQFRSRFKIVHLAHARLCTRRALLQALLYELGLPYREKEEGELRLSLIDYLTANPEAGEGMLLLVDEAHSLPLRLLEELRMITNLVRDGQPRVRLVLAGSPALEERFASPKLEAFNQRIVARCYLEPLSADETAQFVRAQIAACGGKPDEILGPDAFAALYHATDGIPRLVNQVCDHALLLAHQAGVQRIGAAGVEEAWADLQQLPLPWEADRSEGTADQPPDVIEFGALRDDAEEDEPVDERPHPTTRRPVQSFPLEHDEARTAVDVQVVQDDAVIVEDAAPSALPGQLDAEHQLDTIPEQLGMLRDEIVPGQSTVTSVALVVHPPHDPFSEPFDEEEVVIDRYASLDDAILRSRPRVRSREAQPPAGLQPVIDLPEGIGSQITAEPGSGLCGESDAGSKQALRRDPAQRLDQSPAASGDPVLPEPGSELDAPAVPGPHGPDEHDVLIVEDEPVEAAQPTVRRQEFRQLFARLRQK